MWFQEKFSALMKGRDLELAVQTREAAANPGVAVNACVTTETLLLYLASSNNALADNSTAFARLHLREFLKRHGRNLNMEVDTVEDYITPYLM